MSARRCFRFAFACFLAGWFTSAYIQDWRTPLWLIPIILTVAMMAIAWTSDRLAGTKR